MLENHSQCGRSMLEMLGVLAVVGILSVIGIKSFQYAMERHRVNELTEEYIGFIQNLLPYETDFVKIKKQNLLKSLIFGALYQKDEYHSAQMASRQWKLFARQHRGPA